MAASSATFELQARPGDPQVIKACIAAAASGKAVTMRHAEEPAGISVDTLTADLVALKLEDGSSTSSSNAIARLLGGTALSPEEQHWQIEEWLEWEETVLRRAVYLQDESALALALQKLEAALQGREFLLGASVTLADVVIYATLLPLIAADKAVSELRPYLERVRSQPAVQTGLQQTLSSWPADAMAAVFQQDSAVLRSTIPKLPIPGQRNVLITSALPYVNNIPHLGNIIGCVLSADCYARFCRLRGYNTLYICGTDEYGTATETKALEEGLSCQEICDKYHTIHANIYAWFDIAFDKFGRTPTRQQTQISQDIFRRLRDQGHLVEKDMEQLYSEALGKFLADRYVVGTCPKCGYEDARGDQCDNCGNLLNPTELINPKCKFTNTTPILKKTRHMFLDLPRLTPELQEYITTTSQQGGWSANCVQVTSAWMRDGLKLRCITRDLEWGVPVPQPGFEKKVFYVWFDAPIGYISITANHVDDWRAWWQNPKEVELVQFMGKDNVPFHTVIFPATLLGTGQPWTMMRAISVTEYLNYEGRQFSKSRGTGVFGSDARETGIPVEVWRYYLLSNRPEQSDTDFKWTDLQLRNNGELLANLGNFVNRALKFMDAQFGGIVPESGVGSAQAELKALGEKVGPVIASYVAALEKLRIREAIKIALEVSRAGNLFIQENELWKMVKTDRERCGALLAGCVGLTGLLVPLLEPYMPSVATKMLAQLALPASALLLTNDVLQKAYTPHLLIPAGHKIGTPEVLFRNITDAEVAELRERYAGSQQERSAAAAAAGKNGPRRGAAAKAGAVKDAAAAADGPANGASEVSPTEPSSKAKGANRKEKKQKSDETSKEKTDKAADSSKAEELPPDVSRLNLRVGLITKAWRHPDAESLYVEEIDVGEAAPRQVVSGLVKYIPEAAQLEGRRVVVVANMKPANMRGVKSHAMVLAATSPDGTTVELVQPPEGATVGERVTAAGFEGEPDEVLNPKKRVFESVQPHLKTDAQRRACYQDVPLGTLHGPCTVGTIQGGSIK